MCGLSAFTFGWLMMWRGAVFEVVDVVDVVDGPGAATVVVVVVEPDCATAAPAGETGTADQIVIAVAADASTVHHGRDRTPATRVRPALDRLILMLSPDNA